MIVHLIIYNTADDLTAVLWQSNGLGRGFQEIFKKIKKRTLLFQRLFVSLQPKMYGFEFN